MEETSGGVLPINPNKQPRTKDDDEYPRKPGGFFGSDMNAVAASAKSSKIEIS
jgi:hypothetical protein